MVNKRLFKKDVGLLFGLVINLITIGCAHTPPSQLFMLKADPEISPKVDTTIYNQQLSIALGPIHIPDYLNRPQLIIETAENQYSLDEQHRWAERLDQNISRTLSQFFAERLGVSQVLRHPWTQQTHIDFQINIDILELNQTVHGDSRLVAQWQIKRQSETLVSKQFSCSNPAQPLATDMIKAQSRCLTGLGIEIETELRYLALTVKH